MKIGYVDINQRPVELCTRLLWKLEVQPGIKFEWAKPYTDHLYFANYR